MFTLAQVRSRYIARVVKETSSLSEAARVLGINQATLYRHRIREAAKEPETNLHKTFNHGK